MSVLEKRYAIPHRKTLSTRIDHLYDSTFNDLLKDIKESIIKKKFPYSITTDCWTSSTGTADRYRSVTLHHISERWELEAKVLQCMYLPERHTHDNLAEAVESCLIEWSLPKAQLAGVTTGNGANVVKACETMKVHRMP